MTADAVAHLHEVLSRYVPTLAVDRLADYIVKRGVHLRITTQRRSKFGDYRWPQRDHRYHAISVNGNLHPYFFLMVLLHEMGHLETFLAYGNGVKPHGHEWQGQYRRLLIEYGDCFPDEVQPLLSRYVAQIPLHGPSGKQLDKMLQHYGEPETPLVTVDDLMPGDKFRLAERPQILFVAVERRRTRWICIDTASGRRFSVRGTAEVLPE